MKWAGSGLLAGEWSLSLGGVCWGQTLWDHGTNSPATVGHLLYTGFRDEFKGTEKRQSLTSGREEIAVRSELDQ